jgi:hypothetical protein
VIRPTLHLRVTAERVRVELDGAGVLFDEEAAIALRYDARLNDAQICAIYRDALTLSGTLETLVQKGEIDDGDRRACIVPATEAKWWEHVRTFASSEPAPAPSASWEHHGEIVVVHPFAPATIAPFVWQPMLMTARHLALEKEASGHSFRRLRRLCMERWARVEIELPALPADAVLHDRLLRQLWEHFGERVLVDGARPRLRAPLRFADIPWSDRLAFSFPLSLPIAMRLLARRPLPARVMLFLVLGSAAMSLLGWRATLRRGPRVSAAFEPPIVTTIKALRPYAEPGAKPESYAGRGSFLLLSTDAVVGAALPLSALASVFAIIPLLVRLRHPLLPLLLIVGAPVAAIWLAAQMIGARLSAGEHGITLRLRGWLSPALRIPYSRIRRVIAVEGVQQRLRIIFHDGRELPLSASLLARNRSSLRDIEATIAARLASPTSYRASGNTG